MAKNQLLAENERLFKQVQSLKRVLTDALFDLARYQATLEVRRDSLKQYEDLKHLVVELDKEIARVTRLRFEVKEAIFDR